MAEELIKFNRWRKTLKDLSNDYTLSEYKQVIIQTVGEMKLSTDEIRQNQETFNTITEILQTYHYFSEFYPDQAIENLEKKMGKILLKDPSLNEQFQSLSEQVVKEV